LKKKLARTVLFLLACCQAAAFAQTIAPVSVMKLDDATSGVAWLSAERIVTAGQSGVRALSLRDGQWSELIAPTPVPGGLPDPLSVATDGRAIVASNGFERTQFACRADNKQRLFARLSPSFMVIDVAVSGGKLFVLGWPVDASGASNNPDGVAVWRGGLSPLFEKFQPLHRIQAGTESISIFDDSLPIYGGAMAIEPDGTLDVITAAERGIYQYASNGTFRKRLGAALGELVVHRMHDINFTYASDPIARYREVVNRQPTVDDLVVTPDGPAIVVRLARNDRIEWELWYPNADRLDRRVKLGISRRGPFGHLNCDARDSDLICVYQLPDTPQAAVALDQRTVPSYLARFKLPTYHRAVTHAASK
jgi:hypothetical protein